ncbi:MAG TPA: response regulator [Candidatus Paceibacterota bacterium]|nr:response regulator [Candidatus Paceibacterota bacterium]
MPNKPLILIVDDEAAFREIFSTKLLSAGYRIEVAESGAEGVKKAKELKPDLVLLDVNMPVMDGATALLQLQDDPETKGIKTVFLTSLGDPREEIKVQNSKFSEQLGAKGYLRKIDDLDTLVEQIESFLK